MHHFCLKPILNLPIVKPNTNLGKILLDTLQDNQQTLHNDDILIIAQKIVSKAEDCFVRLADVTPSAQAIELAQITNKDPREVEVILWDTAQVIRAKPNILIVEHKLGFISANAGLDRSNVAPVADEILLRLPQNPDDSARKLRTYLQEKLGIQPPVMIIDSHGRPWRRGTTGVTIGVAGLAPVQDLRGQPDLYGTPLKHTEVAFADQIAAAASLVMGQADEACPAVIASGLAFELDEVAQAKDVLRAPQSDLFR